MPGFDSKSRFEDGNSHSDCLGDHLVTADQDMFMEQILMSINSTPIGQVLKRIAELPEVRKEKVLNLRRKITEGQYDLNEGLDIAVDKVIEQLTM